MIDATTENGKRYAVHVSRQWRSFFHACRRVAIANLSLGTVTTTTTTGPHSNAPLDNGGLNNAPSYYYNDIGGFDSGITASWAVVEDDIGDSSTGPGLGFGSSGIPIATGTAFASTTSTPDTTAVNSNLNANTNTNAGIGRDNGRTMTTNPSHILIARGSRGHNPSAALSSPTETHAAASGIFRNENNRDPRARRLHHHSSASRQSQLQSNATNLGTSASGGASGIGGGGYAHGIGGTMSGQWVIDESEADSEREGDEMSDAPTEDVELDPTFTREGRFPGTVKIVVEGITFWAHREILVFASPFFEAALSGDWSETRNVDDREGESEATSSTLNNGSNGNLFNNNNNISNNAVVGRRHSIASSVITIPQPPSNPRDRATKDAPTGISCAPHSDPETETSPEDDVDDLKNELDALNCKTGETSASDADADTEKVRDASLSQLEGKSPTPASAQSSTSIASATQTQRAIALAPTQAQADAIARVKKKKSADAEAKIVLREEKAAIFHDFLKFVYPHLECSITWNNVEGLMNISSKLCVPALTKQCLTFLLTHAAGKPIKAMRIAELFEEEHLYRESSRFVLDNPGGWNETELSTLSQETLLKLEKRRNWFLERVLKLGLVNVAKEYQCCATCPDPPTCARVLDERWRAAYNSCFRFGPCQPSMVYRYLRGLEGVTPPLQLTHLNCQNHAKAFTTTLFDRMFSLGVRGSGSGADPAPLGARVPGVQGPAPGPRRHFLYCSLNP